MSMKLVKAATGMAVIGALAAFGPVAAQAKPAPARVNVPCDASALAAALATAHSGETLILAGGCTYQLTAALPNINDTNLTILGNGATLERSTAEGTPDFSILTVDGDSPGALTLVGVNFVNGGGDTDYYGGAINNQGGNVTVHGASFTGNQSGEYGGAIFSYGTLTLTGTSFTDNTADDYYGGAIYNEGTMKVTGAAFSQNSAEYGGAIYNDGDATLSGDNFSQNDAYEGGALYNSYETTATNTSFTANSAEYGAGIYYDNCGDECDNVQCDDHECDSSLTLKNATVTHNVASEDGGGLYDEDGLVTVNGGLISLNSASSGDGGGIYSHSDGDVMLKNAVVISNKPDNCSPAMAGCVN